MPRRLAASMLLVVLGGACRFDETTVPVGRAEIVVHAVLDPGRAAHRILLERVLTGRVAINEDVPFDSLDPIASRGGSPVSGATVIIYVTAGDTAVGVESTTGPERRGTGVYEFVNAPADLVVGPPEQFIDVVAGGTYHLSISTPDGQTLTGSTTVPRVLSAERRFTSQTFNRDRESRFLFWQPVPGAARYEIVASSPRARFSAFVDSLEFLVSGDLKNTTSGSLDDVFLPGFTQRLTVSAVDQNYFDYYRSQNDAVTGRGLLNHITGGLGVFGSVVVMRYLQLKVTADVDDPLEAYYERRAGPGPRAFQLYVTGRTLDQVALSGNYNTEESIPPGILGRIDGSAVSLALLRGQSATDTLMVIDGKFEGEVFQGRIRADGTAVEYRRLSGPLTGADRRSRN